MVKLCANKSEISHLERVQQRQFWSSIAINVGMSAVGMLPQILSGMFSGSSNEVQTQPETPSVEATPAEETSDAGTEKELTSQQKKDEVVKLIQKKKPNFSANSAHIDKLVSNYDLYKDVYKLSDEDVVTRLCSYYDALISHDVQQTYGVLSAKYELMYAEQTGKSKEEFTEEDYRKILALCIEKEGCNIPKDENSAIENEIIQREKNGGKLTDSYLEAQINRGLGYVDLYDNDHNNLVDFDEFCELEAKDSGVAKLNSEEEAETKKVFDLMDKNGDTYIDAKEMASYLYAVSKINDSSKDTSHNISFVEWAWAQNPAFAERVSNYGDVLYNGIKDMDYPPSETR